MTRLLSFSEEEVTYLDELLKREREEAFRQLDKAQTPPLRLQVQRQIHQLESLIGRIGRDRINALADHHSSQPFSGKRFSPAGG